MTAKTLVKKLMCVVMRNGVEIWTEEDKAKKFQLDLQNGFKGFAIFDGQSINTADVIGVFKSDVMADYSRRKNGEWKCASNNWHARNEKCECVSLENQNYLKARKEAIENCKLGCGTNGFILTSKNTMTLCECVKKVNKTFGFKP